MQALISLAQQVRIMCAAVGQPCHAQQQATACAVPYVVTSQSIRVVHLHIQNLIIWDLQGGAAGEATTLLHALRGLNAFPGDTRCSNPGQEQDCSTQQ